ncbi:hypothetical protein K2173_008112 [Erythroxylum novogranatense]|uniref:3'-5' exonuclease domain-containing protein n=1 Tax=Erythroxylum novogranatense TaxID=1862640 RepID=A0AAV8S966_9ROSI|nr:hypothetical protein K2173_008112 [Erythroxylum novogranatense]
MVTETVHVRFSGEVIATKVTDNASTISSWIRRIKSMYNREEIIVGLDVEWKPNYRVGQNNKAATLQLCVDTDCLIIQLFYLDYIPATLTDFLKDSNVTFVGVEVSRDVDKLSDDYGLETEDNIVDVREMSLQRWPGFFTSRQPGLKEIASQVLGLYMEKPRHITRSNWQVRVLSDEQIEYACIDAYASYRIGQELLKE